MITTVNRRLTNKQPFSDISRQRKTFLQADAVNAERQATWTDYINTLSTEYKQTNHNNKQLEYYKPVGD